MNGMSLVMSKPCCPMYNFAKSKIPCRLSNGISTTCMLKHGAYSISAVKDGKRGLRSQVPTKGKGSGVVVLSASIIIGLALTKHREFVTQFVSTKGAIGEIWKSCACFHFYLVVLALFVVGRHLGDILYGVAVLRLDKPFSIGDIIQVGSVKGEVIRMGLISTLLFSADSLPIKVSNSLFFSQAIVNKSSASYCAMVSKIFVGVDVIDKIHEISEEIIYMMKSNSNVYLEEAHPYCCLSAIINNCAELTLGCNLKNMSEDELFSAKQDILLQSDEIIKKHGVKLHKHMGEVNRYVSEAYMDRFQYSTNSSFGDLNALVFNKFQLVKKMR
ncbi:unnamed protein product [Lactuca virosa]|uniref:Mechanosensitive ion channel MscS domain-containing protein n=1 Tax=Lactuca virosa TaxID=75947 RepID=A0AAU9LPZ0_9ASTR|nr:unnamed protein product [Lactuca virosa]